MIHDEDNQLWSEKRSKAHVEQSRMPNAKS